MLGVLRDTTLMCKKKCRKSDSREYLSCAQSVVPKSRDIQSMCQHHSLHDELLLSGKLADVDKLGCYHSGLAPMSG